MRKILVGVILALCLFCGLVTAGAVNVPTEAEAYQKITAMKSQYPEGKTWTNGSYYSWKGGSYGAGGCMGFAFLMSDAAFGTLPARDIYPSSGNPITISKLRVGDILRLPGHSVVVLEKHSGHIIVTEGNYQRKVHWGRKISAAQVKRANYYTTRYPVGYTETKANPAPAAPAVKEPEKIAVTVNGTTYQVVDIASHWAREHIKSCLTSSLLSASGEASYAYFMPNDSATRAQVVTALYRAKGSPKPSYSSSFTDVPADCYYADAVSWASQNGIVTGVTDTTFAPDAEVTREQLAVIMYRFAGGTETDGELSVYADCGNISSFAENAVLWAVKNNIISGKNGLLLPQGKTTRAEFATMIVRFSMSLAKA
ncbi:MAG: S-layer homology domain-containing protein [Oscillospiraceae bacterium]|nr:S-layer homology domain-containing protein [Oscillospiraceae bacterium]